MLPKQRHAASTLQWFSQILMWHRWLPLANLFTTKEPTEIPEGAKLPWALRSFSSIAPRIIQ